MNLLSLINTYIFGPALPFFIFGAGIFFAFRYRFFHITKIGAIFRVLTKKDDSEGVTPFSAVSLALASTLGVGNIVGVATAIFAGGPGAVFWLWVSAFFSMLVKYSEVLLGMIHRKKEGDIYHGGAYYYIRDGLKKPAVAALFSLLFILNGLTVGNIVQVKAAGDSFNSVFGIPHAVIGIVMAFFTFAVICGGVKKITSVTVKIIPCLSLVFIAFSMYIIVRNIQLLPSVFARIISSALTPRAIGGSFSGIMFMKAMRFGVTRGILSNEAGSGTSPTAHSSSNSKSPVEQGFWGIFEVFIDTIVVCSMTAMVILISYDKFSSFDGMELSILAYGEYLGSWAGIFLSVSVLIFAYATLICQGFYGCECLHFLTGSNKYAFLYKCFFCLIIFIGSIIPSGFIWDISDFVVSFMTIINTLCVCAQNRIVVSSTREYFAKNTVKQSQIKQKCPKMEF